MHQIPRHHYDIPLVKQKKADYHTWLRKDRTLLNTNPRTLNNLAYHAHQYLSCTAALNPVITAECVDTLLLATEAKSALFTLATAAPGSTVEIFLAEDLITGLAVGDPYRPHTDWHAAFYDTVITRRTDLGQMLVGVADQVFVVPGVTDDAYAKPWTEALKAVWENDMDTAATQLTTAIDLAHQTGHEWAQRIAAPAMRVLANVIEDNPMQLTTDLIAALEDHKTYWSLPERRNKPGGFLSYELMAMCALAYDYGMDIEVESDYIPHHLITDA